MSLFEEFINGTYDPETDTQKWEVSDTPVKRDITHVALPYHENVDYVNPSYGNPNNQFYFVRDPDILNNVQVYKFHEIPEYFYNKNKLNKSGRMHTIHNGEHVSVFDTDTYISEKIDYIFKRISDIVGSYARQIIYDNVHSIFHVLYKFTDDYDEDSDNEFVDEKKAVAYLAQYINNCNIEQLKSAIYYKIFADSSASSYYADECKRCRYNIEYDFKKYIIRSFGKDNYSFTRRTTSEIAKVLSTDLLDYVNDSSLDIIIKLFQEGEDLSTIILKASKIILNSTTYSSIIATEKAALETGIKSMFNLSDLSDKFTIINNVRNVNNIDSSEFPSMTYETFNTDLFTDTYKRIPLNFDTINKVRDEHAARAQQQNITDGIKEFGQ